jgi:MraZ protein
VEEFWGEYEFTLDDRGRLSVPADFRHAFADGAMLTMNPDGCIECYTKAGYREMAKDVAEKPRTTSEGRQARRDFYGQSFGAELDRQGRILIPPKLRQKADVQGPVLIQGNLECLEIWNPERRKRQDAKAASSSEQASEG